MSKTRMYAVLDTATYTYKGHYYAANPIDAIQAIDGPHKAKNRVYEHAEPRSAGKQVYALWPIPLYEQDNAISWNQQTDVIGILGRPEYHVRVQEITQ